MVPTFILFVAKEARKAFGIASKYRVTYLGSAVNMERGKREEGGARQRGRVHGKEEPSDFFSYPVIVLIGCSCVSSVLVV